MLSARSPLGVLQAVACVVVKNIDTDQLLNTEVPVVLTQTPRTCHS
jgi:hypothetical protein